MSTLLLTTKLYIPPVRLGLVSRPRLVERLNRGLGCKLTLISAPAGFGKTTLLSEWISQSQRCVCWVSLDEGDNDPTRFWSYFITGLQRLKPGLAENALLLFQSPQQRDDDNDTSCACHPYLAVRNSWIFLRSAIIKSNS